MSTWNESRLEDSYSPELDDLENLNYWGDLILSKEIGEDGRTRYDAIKDFEGLEREFKELEPALKHRIFYDFMTGLYEELDLDRPAEPLLTSGDVYDLLESLNDDPDNQTRFEEMKYVPDGFEPVNEVVRRRIAEKADDVDIEVQELRPDNGSVSDGNRVFLQTGDWEATGRMSFMEDSY